MHLYKYAILCMIWGTLIGCSTIPPENPHQACDILKEKKHWKKPLRKAQKNWNTPPEIVLSFMFHESSFRAQARPKRKKLLGFIPWFRPSNAYGYAQATKETWQTYEASRWRFLARRDNFADSTDFIGWYNSISTKKYSIPPTDSYRLYLVYHEGHYGYGKGSYQKKQWLLNTARAVQNKANHYQQQLKKCPL